MGLLNFRPSKGVVELTIYSSYLNLYDSKNNYTFSYTGIVP